VINTYINQEISGDIKMSKKIPRILRLRRVLDKTGESRSGVYRKMAAGDFPSTIKLSARSVGWREDEVDAWIEERIINTRGRYEEKI
jgi:prophage regulatory protein